MRFPVRLVSLIALAAACGPGATLAQAPTAHNPGPDAPPQSTAPVAPLAAPPAEAPTAAEPPPAHLFLSPSGEPFRRGPGTPNPFEAWFARADANHDGKIDRAEFRADAQAFFKRLDTNGDGVIDGFEVNAYEHDVAPELVSEVENRAFGGAQRVYRGDAGRAGRQQAAAAQREAGPPPERGHAALLNEPEPVSGADMDLDGRVSAAEWLASTDRRFDMLDDKGAGVLTLEALVAKLPKPAKPRKGDRGEHGEPARGGGGRG